MGAFEAKSITRNRTVGWGVLTAGAKPGAITSADCLNEDGTVNVAFCQNYRIDPAGVAPITVADLPKEYAEGPKAALTKLASEWSVGKDERGQPVKWTPDEVIHYLVIQSRLTDAANASIKQHRPVSDKALDRATSTMVKTMKSNGKTLPEIVAVFAAMGSKVDEGALRDAFGA